MEPDYFGRISIPIGSTPLDDRIPMSGHKVTSGSHRTIEDVNRWVNRSITYRADPTDRWQAPAETMALGAGDCEDLALLKRALLVGHKIVDPANIFLVVGRELVSRKDHAMLVVRDRQQWLVLDNIARVVMSDAAFVGAFLPYFSFSSLWVEFQIPKKWIHGKAV